MGDLACATTFVCVYAYTRHDSGARGELHEFYVICRGEGCLRGTRTCTRVSCMHKSFPISRPTATYTSFSLQLYGTSARHGARPKFDCRSRHLVNGSRAESETRGYTEYFYCLSVDSMKIGDRLAT